jgi:hypothetical protein
VLRIDYVWGMRRTIITMLLVLVSLLGYSDTIPEVINKIEVGINPLDTLQFDEIIASNINFDFKTKKRTYRGDSFDEYTLTAIDASSITEVDSSQFKYILDLFSDTATYGDNYGDCFEPRFALQFKRNKEEVFRILICEDCNQLESTVPIPAAYQKFYDIGSSDNGKDITIRRYLSGFSKSGKVKINDLCRKLNLEYCQEKRISNKALDTIIAYQFDTLESKHDEDITIINCSKKSDFLLTIGASTKRKKPKGILRIYDLTLKKELIKYSFSLGAASFEDWILVNDTLVLTNLSLLKGSKIIALNAKKLKVEKISRKQEGKLDWLKNELQCQCDGFEEGSEIETKSFTVKFSDTSISFSPK